mmetsp:Transcript_7309/g.23043  ORF Transcript_7309/g.23043 Transcript_7309/m.23043 type:complete len:283 (-) Transcript_7309:14-862(-)
MSLYKLAAAAARRWPSSVALVSQSEALTLSFEELERRAAAAAGVISRRGLAPGSVLVSDLKNSSSNLVTQLACSKLGVAYGTAKNEKALAALQEKLDVGGVLAESDDSFLREAGTTTLSAAELLDEAAASDVTGANAAHGFYNSTSPLTNAEIESLAADAAEHLALTPDDTVCVSVTLSHSFGIASAAAACLLSGATIALPNVDGIVGCGVPSDRAAATLLALQDGATVLVADTHTLKALPEDAVIPSLRDGVCKIASGSDFLERSTPFAGTTLWTLGKRDA